MVFFHMKIVLLHMKMVFFYMKIIIFHKKTILFTRRGFILSGFELFYLNKTAPTVTKLVWSIKIALPFSRMF